MANEAVSSLRTSRPRLSNENRLLFVRGPRVTGLIQQVAYILWIERHGTRNRMEAER